MNCSVSFLWAFSLITMQMSSGSFCLRSTRSLKLSCTLSNPFFLMNDDMPLELNSSGTMILMCSEPIFLSMKNRNEWTSSSKSSVVVAAAVSSIDWPITSAVVIVLPFISRLCCSVFHTGIHAFLTSSAVYIVLFSRAVMNCIMSLTFCPPL